MSRPDLTRCDDKFTSVRKRDPRCPRASPGKAILQNARLAPPDDRDARRASLRRQSSVDHEFRAGRERGFVAREEEDRVRDLFGLAHAPHRRGALEARAHPLRVLRPRDAFEHHRRFGERGMHRIHANFVAGAGAMKRGGFGEEPDRPLARAIGRDEASPMIPATEERLTIEPPPVPFIARTASRQPRNAPSALTALTFRQSASVVVSILPRIAIPGAVDENVETPERGDDLVDHFAPARFVGHVLHEREIGVFTERLEARFVAVGRGDLGALRDGREPPSPGRCRTPRR